VTTETAQGTDLDTLAVDTVRTLAMDAIQKAGDGHPGTAMALGPAALTPSTRTGSTATASCSPTATPRCCSTSPCT
jgi:hypothetical protein